MMLTAKLPTGARFAAICLCLFAALAAGATSYKLKLHKVMDPGTGMLAGSYLIPAGWTAKDEITWITLNYGTPCVGKSTITSPDGSMSLVTVTALSFNYGQSAYGRNGLFPPPSICDFLAQLWSREHPGVQFQMISKEESPINRQSGQYLTYNYDGTAKLAFDQNGQHMVVKGYGRIDGYQTVPVGAAMVTEGQWTISNVIAATAPEDKLPAAMKLYAICLASAQIDPHFFNVVLQVQRGAIQHAYRESENALELSRHLAQNQSAISADIMSVYNNRVKVEDHENEQFDDYIRGEETFTGPDGVKVKLPNWHAHLYTDGVGDYYYSDKPGGAQGNFTAMKPS